MKTLGIFLAAGLMLVLPGWSSQRTVSQSGVEEKAAAKFIGQWKLKFTMEGVEKNIIVFARRNGAASFKLLDTAEGNKPVAGLKPAAWAALTNDRISISGEAELPIGTCCREIGTVTFKGKFTSPQNLAGKVLFVTSVDDEESPVKLRAIIGTFTAVRISK